MWFISESYTHSKVVYAVSLKLVFQINIRNTSKIQLLRWTKEEKAREKGLGFLRCSEITLYAKIKTREKMYPHRMYHLHAFSLSFFFFFYIYILFFVMSQSFFWNQSVSIELNSLNIQPLFCIHLKILVGFYFWRYKKYQMPWKECRTKNKMK